MTELINTTFDPPGAPPGWILGADWGRTTPGLNGTVGKLSANFSQAAAQAASMIAFHAVVGAVGDIEETFLIETHTTIASRGMLFGLGANFDASTDVAVYCRVFGSNIQYFDNAGAGWTNALAVTADTEYTVKIVCNPTAFTFDLYINDMGTPIVTDVGFWNDVDLDYVFKSCWVTASGGAPITESATFDEFILSDSVSVDGIAIDPFGFYLLALRLATLESSTKSRTGTYTAVLEPTAIEGRIVLTGTSTPLAGFDWQVFDAAPAGGTFAGTWTGIPEGGLYEEQYRLNNTPAVTTTGATEFGVGLIIGSTGQSLEQQMFSEGSAVTPTDSRMFKYDQTSGLETLLDGDGAVSCANALRANGFTGDILFLNHAEDGAGLVADAVVDNKYWLYLTDYTNNAVWLPFVDSINDVGGDVSCITWDQGPREARSGAPVAAQYGAGEITLFSRMRTATHAGVPIITTLLGRGQDVADVAADFQTIRVAKMVNRDADANVNSIHCMDQPLRPDGFDIHLTDDGYGVKGERYGQQIAYQAGLVANPALGPVISAANVITAATTRSVFTADDTILPATGTTGIDADVGGVFEATTGVVAGLTVTLTHSSGLVENLRGLYGNDPDITGLPTADGLPMEPFEIAVTAGPVPDVTITSPTTDPTYPTDTTPVDLAGTSAVSSGTVDEVRWVNDRGGSGVCTGTTNWSQLGITLFSGVNIITITAESDLGETNTDVIAITYTPVVPGDPVVTITSPTTDPTYDTGTGFVSMAGTATVATGNILSVTWTIDTGCSGICETVGLGTDSVTWSAEIPLVDGDNIINIIATSD